MFEFTTEFPLALDENTSYFGIANDGHQTYLSSGDRQIFTFNDCCCLINQVDTCCSYHTICYDSTRNRFWAASSDSPGILFCLSEKLEELEPIHLCCQDLDPIDIDHLFYDANGKRLCFTIKKQVYTADQTGHLQKLFEIKTEIDKLEGICAYHSYFLCLSIRQGERYLSIHSLADGALLEEYGVPVPFQVPFQVSSMTFIQDPLNPLSLRLRMMAKKHGDTPFFMDYQPNLVFFTQYSAACLADGGPAVSVSDIQMQQLCQNRGPNPFFRPGCGRSCSHNGPHNDHPSSCFPVPPADFCSNPCPCCPGDSPGNCQPGSGCCQSYSDVIESIALTEASIAHILNAEGEKLQKAIACSKNVSELLRVNESVLKTITHSTHLEQVLYCKLEAILNAGCMEHHTPDPHCCQDQFLQDECSDSIYE